VTEYGPSHLSSGRPPAIPNPSQAARLGRVNCTIRVMIMMPDKVHHKLKMIRAGIRVPPGQRPGPGGPSYQAAAAARDRAVWRLRRLLAASAAEGRGPGPASRSSPGRPTRPGWAELGGPRARAPSLRLRCTGSADHDSASLFRQEYHNATIPAVDRGGGHAVVTAESVTVTVLPWRPVQCQPESA
jgi:hypothetical protein